MANLEEIIAAAAKVFQTKGYHAATVQDIADAVGILKGSLYHHVKSKEDLLYLIVNGIVTRPYIAHMKGLQPSFKLSRSGVDRRRQPRVGPDRRVAVS